MTEGVRLYDLRGEQTDPAPKSRIDWRGRTIHRDPKKITGVTIHQTAVSFGVTSRMIAEAGGDERLALARRGLKVPAHVEAFRDGTVAATDDVTAYLNHAGRLNAASAAEEIDGRYSGLLDRPETAPREDLRTTWGSADPQRFEGLIVDASRTGLVWIVTELRRMGAPVRYVWAHRQSSSTRRADPGEGIWRGLVLDFAVPYLGLATQPGRTWGKGRPIPRQWDPDGVGDY